MREHDDVTITHPLAGMQQAPHMPPAHVIFGFGAVTHRDAQQCDRGRGLGVGPLRTPLPPPLLLLLRPVWTPGPAAPSAPLPPSARRLRLRSLAWPSPWGLCRARQAHTPCEQCRAIAILCASVRVAVSRTEASCWLCPRARGHPRSCTCCRAGTGLAHMRDA